MSMPIANKELDLGRSPGRLDTLMQVGLVLVDSVLSSLLAYRYLLVHVEAAELFDSCVVHDAILVDIALVDEITI